MFYDKSSRQTGVDCTIDVLLTRRRARTHIYEWDYGVTPKQMKLSRYFVKEIKEFLGTDEFDGMKPNEDDIQQKFISYENGLYTGSGNELLAIKELDAYLTAKVHETVHPQDIYMIECSTEQNNRKEL